MESAYYNYAQTEANMFGQYVNVDNMPRSLPVEVSNVQSVCHRSEPRKRLKTKYKRGLLRLQNKMSNQNVIKEAQKLGFNGAIAPKKHLKSSSEGKEINNDIHVIGISHLIELLEYIRIKGKKT